MPTGPGMQADAVPAWIRPGHAYPGWGWVVAHGVLWALFGLLLATIAELQRGMEGGVLSRAALGYHVTAAAAMLVGVCAFLRRRWARQLLLVTAAPMLLFVPVGTLVAAFALRALLRNRDFFEASRT